MNYRARYHAAGGAGGERTPSAVAAGVDYLDVLSLAGRTVIKSPVAD